MSFTVSFLGFYSVEEIEYTTRLYRIHEAAHGIHLEAVPTEFHSLDSRYVFLLDGGLRCVCPASSFNFILCKAVVSFFSTRSLGWVWKKWVRSRTVLLLELNSNLLLGSRSVIGVQSQSDPGSFNNPQKKRGGGGNFEVEGLEKLDVVSGWLKASLAEASFMGV
jgi:hypothetical protein